MCQLNRADLTWLFMALPVLAPLVIISGILYFLSWVSGWRALAEKYPMTCEAPRPRMLMGYGVFRGWCGYNGCLIVSADHTGLFVSLWPVFAILHPPIFIPWEEVREIRRKTLWWKPLYKIVTQRAPEVDFALRDSTFEYVRAQAEAQGASVSARIVEK